MTLLRAFYILTCVSLAASTAVFVLSMLELGFDSLQINPTAAGLTIVYHVVILILQRREYNEDIPPQYRDYPASKIASLVFAYLLAFLWPVPLGIVLIHRSSATIAQAALDAVEFVVVLAIAIVCTRMKVAADRWERNHRPACVVVFFLSIHTTLTLYTGDLSTFPIDGRRVLSLGCWSLSSG